MKSEAVHIFVGGNPSLSVRRAWIEIDMKNYKTEGGKVALREESVD